MNKYHKDILDQIVARSGKPTEHTFSDSYLGNAHPRYPINAPTLRAITKKWVIEHKAEVSLKEFQQLITDLIKGKSSTEKMAAGMLLDFSPKPWRKFDPTLFDKWLNHLQGWAEVDSVCTGSYTIFEIPENFPVWKKILIDFSKSKRIEKRRASLVLLCSPLSRMTDDRLLQVAFQNINRVKHEKDVLITKAVSWLLRSAVKNHKQQVQAYIDLQSESLPKIAVRETLVKLKTGKKTKSKIKI
jgi:3-methyladenine DNA glycosylase AlkD